MESRLYKYPALGILVLQKPLFIKILLPIVFIFAKIIQSSLKIKSGKFLN
jgi:hypothetical protein